MITIQTDPPFLCHHHHRKILKKQPISRRESPILFPTTPTFSSLIPLIHPSHSLYTSIPPPCIPPPTPPPLSLSLALLPPTPWLYLRSSFTLIKALCNEVTHFPPPPFPPFPRLLSTSLQPMPLYPVSCWSFFFWLWQILGHFLPGPGAAGRLPGPEGQSGRPTPPAT